MELRKDAAQNLENLRRGACSVSLHSDVSVDNPAILQLLMSCKLYSICVLAVSALCFFDVNACYLGSQN